MKLREIWGNTWFMLRAVARASRRYALLSVIVSVLVALDTVIVNALLVKYLYDALAGGRPFSEILLWLSCAGALLTLRFALRAYGEECLRPRALAGLRGELCARLFDKAVSLDIERYEQPAFYDEYVLALTQAETRAMQIFDALMQLLSYALMFAGLIGVMAALDAYVMLPAALYFAGTFLISLRRAKLTHARDVALKPDERRRDAGTRVFYLARYAKELRMTGVGAPIREGIARAFASMTRTHAQYGKKFAWLSMLDEFACESLILNGGLYGYLAYALIVRGSITPGALLSLSFAAENVIWRMNDLISIFPQFVGHARYVRNLREFLKQAPAIVSGALPPPSRAPLVLRDVTFAYPGQPEPVLRALNLTIAPGEKLAIVGENGAGKSTLVKLLLRLYDVDGGAIELGGIDIRALDLTAYRARFAALFQDYQLYALSLAENVTMGEPIGPDGPDGMCRPDAPDATATPRTPSTPDGIATPRTPSSPDGAFTSRTSSSPDGAITPRAPSSPNATATPRTPSTPDGPTDSDDRPRVRAALLRAGFPLERCSADAPLTREFDESGVELSGGEAQKLAIARVFYRDAELLVLDEPSAALDPISEYALNRSLLDAARDKTVVFISHRLSTTRVADRIVFLGEGGILEQGSHAQLMALGGRYARMFELQARRYLANE